MCIVELTKQPAYCGAGTAPPGVRAKFLMIWFVKLMSHLNVFATLDYIRITLSVGYKVFTSFTVWLTTFFSLLQFSCWPVYRWRVSTLRGRQTTFKWAKLISAKMLYTLFETIYLHSSEAFGRTHLCFLLTLMWWRKFFAKDLLWQVSKEEGNQFIQHFLFSPPAWID